MRESFKYAWREIKRRKQRTAGVVLSFFFTGAIVVLVTTLAGTTRDTTQKVLWDIGAHTVGYIPRLTIEGCCIQTYATDLYDPDREGFVVNNAPSNLIFEDQIERIKQSPNVADAAPYLMFRIRASAGRGEWILGGIDLTRPVAYSATVVAKSQVVEGVFIEPGDMSNIMIEQEFAGTYGLGVGSDLILGDMNYTVAAIVNPPLRPGKANIYMSLPALRQLVATRLEEQAENPVNAVLVESRGADYHDAAKADIARILGNASRISSYGCYQPGVTAMGITGNTALTITAIVVLCMFMIAGKIQYSSIVRRKFEIGILKAIGWRERTVVLQIMSESFIYALSGGLLGVAASIPVIMSLPADLVAGREMAVDPVVLLAGLILPVAGGIITGVASSLRAVQMETADILRSI